MSSAVNILLSIVATLFCIVALCMTSLALGGGTWIQEIQNQGDFFSRASYSYEDSMFANEDLLSMGMWRYFTAPGVSNPLPFRGY